MANYPNWTKELIMCSAVFDPDKSLLSAVFEMGIDSHLEAFVESKATVGKEGRLRVNVRPAEAGIFLRRLAEMSSQEDDPYDNLAFELLVSILHIIYGMRGEAYLDTAVQLAANHSKPENWPTEIWVKT